MPSGTFAKEWEKCILWWTGGHHIKDTSKKFEEDSSFLGLYLLVTEITALVMQSSVV